MAKSKNSLSANKQVEYYKKALNDGTIPDEQNPVAMVQVFSPELLIKIALGHLDMKSFAIYELKARGLGKKGKWVGFSQAEAIWEKANQAEKRKYLRRL